MKINNLFCLKDQATEVILTLGQAFEVAYQMALKEKLGGQAVRSQSANQLTSLSNSGNTIVTNTKTSNATSKCPQVRANTVDMPMNQHLTIDTKNNSSNSNTQNTNTLKSVSKLKPSNNPNVTTSNHNSHGNLNVSSNSNLHGTTRSNCTSGVNPNATCPKPLVTHGRSHSVNDIKINGNQLKLVPTPVDDIGIGVKDLKAGSRAPIALSEEL